jgi:membrane-associated protein
MEREMRAQRERATPIRRVRQARPGTRSVVAILLLLLLIALVLLVVMGDDLLDLTAPLRRTVISLLGRYGPPAAFALLYLEESGLPLFVPGDVYVMYIGHRAAGQPLVWVASWLGLTMCVTLGATNLYLISRRLGRGLVHGRMGRALHLTEERLVQGERWFARWGLWAIIFGRHVPGLRLPITVAAGALGVSYPVFAFGVAISSAVWAAFFMLIGSTFGGEIQTVFRLQRKGVLLAGALVIVVAVVLFRLRGRRRTT